jgi:hypothetical protein
MLNDLKNEIILLPPTTPVVIYIGVGAAANLTNNLPQSDYQQFPPFLQDIHNQVPDLNTFLLLLDPRQESPPYVAVDYELPDCHNHYGQDRLKVFAYPKAVYTEPDFNPPEGGENITAILRELNQFAQEKNLTLVYHDFSGRKTALLAEYFDHELRGHLDQIVYGLSAREDHGCFFDLTQAYFPFRVDLDKARPVVKLFNYYKYIVSNTYQESQAELLGYEMRHLADLQRNQIIQIRLNQLKNTNLSLLRQVRKIILNPQEEAEAELYIINDLPYLYRQMFIDLYTEKEYDLLYELLFNYSANDLDGLAKLKGMDMTGEEILNFITLDENPYKWYNVINEIIQ